MGSGVMFALGDDALGGDALGGEALFGELERVVDAELRRGGGRRHAKPEPFDLDRVSETPAEVAEAEMALAAMQARMEYADGDEAMRLLAHAARIRAMAEAAEAAALHRVTSSSADVDAGYRNPTSLVKNVAKARHGDAARLVGVASKVRDLPRTLEAFELGGISETHVARLCQAAGGHRREAFLAAEVLLVEAALRLPFRRFSNVVAHFEQATEPDIDDWDERERAKRSAELRRCRRERGGGTLEATFDAESFAIFAKVLRGIEKELFDADWAEAAERLGEGNVILDDLWRSPTQRRHDALTEMARRAAAMPPGSRRPQPSVVVHISHEAFEAEIKRRVGAEFAYPADFSAELEDGTPISPGRALALAVEGEVRRLVFDVPDVQTTFGRSKRFADGALRAMIQARDRHCQAPGCDVPAFECDIDHIIDWQYRGRTNAEDLECKCRWHNRVKDTYDIHVDTITGAAIWRRRARGR